MGRVHKHPSRHGYAPCGRVVRNASGNIHKLRAILLSASYMEEEIILFADIHTYSTLSDSCRSPENIAQLAGD